MADGIAVALPLGVNDTDGAYILHKDLTSMAEQNLKMVILTNPGERIMVPEFGAGVRNSCSNQPPVEPQQQLGIKN